jgi:hypothetical protein
MFDYNAQRDRIAQSMQQMMPGGTTPAWMNQPHTTGTPMDSGTGGQINGSMANAGPFDSWYKGPMGGTPTNMMSQLPTQAQPMTPGQPLGMQPQMAQGAPQPPATASEQMLTGTPAPTGMIGQAGWGAPPMMQRSQPVTGNLQVTGSLGAGGMPSPGGKGQGATPPPFGG